MKSTTILCAGLTLLLAGCGSEASVSTEGAEHADSTADSHDTSDPIGEHADDHADEHADVPVSEMDIETLEARLAEAKLAVKDKKAELKGLKQELEAQLEKSAGDVVGLLSGDTSKQAELDADLTAMKDRVKTLEAELETLKAHVNTYADELAKR